MRSEKTESNPWFELKFRLCFWKLHQFAQQCPKLKRKLLLSTDSVWSSRSNIPQFKFVWVVLVYIRNEEHEYRHTFRNCCCFWKKEPDCKRGWSCFWLIALQSFLSRGELQAKQMSYSKTFHDAVSQEKMITKFSVDYYATNWVFVRSFRSQTKRFDDSFRLMMKWFVHNKKGKHETFHRLTAGKWQSTINHGQLAVSWFYCLDFWQLTLRPLHQ